MLKILYSALIVLISLLIGYFGLTYKPKEGRPRINQLAQIYDLFPSSGTASEQRVQATIDKVTTELEGIYKVPDGERTFKNTLDAFDLALEQFKIAQSSLYVLSIASPEEEVRTAAQQGVAQLQAFAIDAFSLNQKLYDAVLAYKKRLDDEKHEELNRKKLNKEETYFLEETLKDFKRSGLQLPKEEQEKARALQKEIAQLSLTYDTTLSAARGSIEVPLEGLKGLEQSFIDTLERTDEGNYIITTDYSQFLKVHEQCEVADTRKRLYHAFVQRAYPENEKVLEKIIALQDELSKLLGYTSYSHFVLDDQMAKSPEKAQEFLDNMVDRFRTKAERELELVTKDLPESVILKDGKVEPWDVAFLYNAYKKKHLQVDEAEISQYFPLEYTLPALLKIYEDFFGLQFKKLKKVYLWHEDVEAYAVYKQGHYRGTVLLDIFPRPFKFSHAGQITVVPSVKEPSGKILPAVIVVLANFPRDTLNRTEVITFFHEFGHAIHALLGATQLSSFSGTSTKGDFVEMPSQMLEEWLWDPEILKDISSHSTTKEPLPDELIKKILALKNFDTGNSMLRQLYLADVSLAYYMSGAQKSAQQLWQSYHEKLRPHMVFDPLNKGYCSFMHIVGYGPRYYGYLWSKVFALDLFSQIKPRGLRNKDTGARYSKEVLSKGGSQDPEELLVAFLERKPSPDAFFEDLGL